jgi:exopolyphosphatase/guanosine-5'-triphosphate,3'-diphosphate pyrophosphatase
LVFSAYGLREGWVFDRLPCEEQVLDPLEAAAREWGLQDGRFGEIGDAVADWIAPLFAQESAPARRLRLATCLLADIGWRYHPDYRAEQTMLRILRAQELCVEHHERAFIASALHARYGGKRGRPRTDTVDALLRPKKAKRAIALGCALRLAYALSVGSLDMLACTRLALDGDTLTLRIPAQASVPPGKTIEKRLGAVARALGLRDSRVLVT